MRGWILGLLLFIAAPAAAAPCGSQDTPCKVDARNYYVALPEPSGSPAPVFLFLHGYGGSGAAGIRNKGMVDRITGRGYAFVTMDGQFPINGPGRRDWAVDDGAPELMEFDDVAHIGAVLDDVATRFSLDRTRVLATGFSRGGLMIWDLACRTPDVAAAYAPVSGAFWEPMTPCKGGVHLFHTHGVADRTVPMEGRKANFNGHDFEQGDLMKSLDLLGAASGCPVRADSNDTGGTLWFKRWTGCRKGSMTVALWPGGHGIPKGWSDLAMNWFEALPR